MASVVINENNIDNLQASLTTHTTSPQTRDRSEVGIPLDKEVLCNRMRAL